MWPIIRSQMATTATHTVARTRGGTRPGRRSVRGTVTSGLARFQRVLESTSVGPNSHAMLIGVDTRDSLQLLRSVEAGLPYGAFERLVANTSLSSDDALTLVSIPKRTLTRRRREGRFRQDESDRLVRAARIFGRALSLFDGNLAGAKDWLSRPQKALGGGVPLELARTEVGAIEVERVLGRLEHGVYT